MIRVGIFVFGLVLGGCATVGQSPGAQTTAPQNPLTKEDRAAAISHYLASVIYERTGNAEEAVEELRDAADISPEAPQLVVRLLGAYYVNEDYDNAASMAVRALKGDPDSVVLHIWYGRILYRLQRFDEATVEFERAVALEPDNAMAYEAMAEIEEETNDLIGAIDIYRRMIELTPDSAFLHYRLGMNLVEVNDDAGARSELERAVTLNPQLSPAYYMLGLIYMDDEEYETALLAFRHFLADNGNHLPSQLNILATLTRMERYDEAIALLTKVIEGPAADTEHHLLRTFLLLRRGGAIRAGQAAAPNGAPLFGTVLQALVRRSQGEPYAPLLESLDSVEGDLDLEANVYLNRLISLFGEKQGDYLADQLAGLIDEGAHSRTVEVFLGRALMSLDRNEEAEAVLRRILERYDPDKWLHYYLATVYEELDRPSLAEEQLRAALEFDPNDADVLNFLGYHLAEKGRNLGEAEHLIERALQLDPDNGFYLDSLGWVYYRQGKGDEAVEHIRRAIRVMNSDDAVLRDHLGDAYLLQGDMIRAVKEWQRAHRLDTDLKGVREKIERYLPQISE